MIMKDLTKPSSSRKAVDPVKDIYDSNFNQIWKERHTFLYILFINPIQREHIINFYWIQLIFYISWLVTKESRSIQNTYLISWMDIELTMFWEKNPPKKTKVKTTENFKLKLEKHLPHQTTRIISVISERKAVCDSVFANAALRWNVRFISSFSLFANSLLNGKIFKNRQSHVLIFNY